METTLIVIENDEDLKQAQDLVSQLMDSSNPLDLARLRAQAIILQAYEGRRFQTKPATVAEIIQYIMDQHDLTPAEMAPILGTRSRVSEVLNGHRPLSTSMIRRLRSTFHVSADALIPG